LASENLIACELKRWMEAPAAPTPGNRRIPSFREAKIGAHRGLAESLGKDCQALRGSYFYSDSLNDIRFEEVTDPVPQSDDTLRAHLFERLAQSRSLSIRNKLHGTLASRPRLFGAAQSSSASPCRSPAGDGRRWRGAWVSGIAPDLPGSSARALGHRAGTST